MREVRYVSENGEFILNQNAEITIKSFNPWSSSWDYDSVEKQYGVRLKRFRKKPLSLKISLRFKREYARHLNEFFMCCEKDVLNNTPGKLYVDDEYIEGFVISRDTIPSEDFYGYQQDITFFAPYPFWITEESRSFSPSAGSEATTGLDYDYDYEYDYAPSVGGNIIWNSQHYADSDFIMTIYGPCINPRISIGGHPYSVNATLSENESVIIDSSKHTVTLVSNGEEFNAFDMRNKEQSVFDKIPSGSFNVVWSGLFGFNIVLKKERGEPIWK